MNSHDEETILQNQYLHKFTIHGDVATYEYTIDYKRHGEQITKSFTADSVQEIQNELSVSLITNIRQTRE